MGGGARAGGSSAARLLLVGADGQLGFELARALAPLGTLVATSRRADAAPGCVRLDLEDLEAVERVVREAVPDVVVNAAAYTAVDRAEDEPERALRVNAEAPGRLAAATARAGALLVHYSTDYVFDGEAAAPYPETAPVCPINAYGRSKAAGEAAVRAAAGRHLVLRTSWVYAARGRNFVRAILARADSGEPLRVVSDQTGRPTSARFLADASARIVRRALAEGSPWVSAHSGVYHLAAGGQASWFDFAREALRLAGRAAAAAAIEAIPSTEFPTRAPRPRFTVLDCTAVARVFGIVPSPWQAQLAEVVSEMGER